MLRISFLILFNFLFILIKGNDIKYGLTFNSHSVNQDLRTSLDLTPAKPLYLPIGFSIEFSIKFNPGIQAYGYVCRIISDDRETFDIISNINARKLNCVLVDVDKALSNVDFKVENSVERKDWNVIKIHFRTETINCHINDEIKTMPYSFTDFKKINFIFGKNSDIKFYSSDVPPISVKDIIIRDENGKILYNWKMEKHAGDKVFDEITIKEASVENGIWDIDNYIKWKKEATTVVAGKYPQLAFDSIKSIFYIGTQDSMVIFNLSNHAAQRRKILSGSPYACGTNSQVVYDQMKDRLISYSHLYPDLLYYDFNTDEWSGENKDQRFATSHQHNRFIDYEKNRLVTFGGYGFQTYKGWLSFHSLDNGDWSIHDISDKIAPRYLSASGYLGNGKFLILGGYGSISGKQEESPKNFYDLYEIDSYSMECRKLFDLKFPIEPLAFSNSMIIDKENEKIYALGYDNHRYNTFLHLCEISLTDGAVNILADSIPYNFQDMESFSDLILDEEKSVLYAITLHKNPTINTFDIYSLSYPPLKTADVIQTVTPAKRANHNIVFFLLAFLILSALLIIIIRFNHRRKKRRNILTEKELPLNREFAKTGEDPVKFSHFSTIKLLGGFQAFDRDGNDITDSFAPILKQLFLFILLSSIKDGKKITSEKLDETLWFQMDKASASNNRSVNVRKLRILLEKIGDVALVNKRSYWFIEINEDVYCDYKDIMSLFKLAKDKGTVSREVLDKIINTAQNGVLLPNLNSDWVDDYKSEYANILIDILSKATEQTDIKTDQKLLLNIANVMLLHDNIDEEAIKIKCRALFMLGQKGLSKQYFDKFVQDYQRLLNEIPQINYEDIIS